MKLFLARHGETDDTYAGRYVGALDPPLSSHGREQARRLGTVLPEDLRLCLCSPMLRAHETAQIALAGRDCRIELIDTLREIDFGRWEGLSFAEIAAQDQRLIDEWQRDVSAFHFPGGEQTKAFCARIQETLQLIAATNEKEVLVICHGGVIRAMLCTLLGVPFDRYLSFTVKPAALTGLEVYGHHGVLQFLNL